MEKLKLYKQVISSTYSFCKLKFQKNQLMTITIRVRSGPGEPGKPGKYTIRKKPGKKPGKPGKNTVSRKK